MSTSPLGWLWRRRPHDHDDHDDDDDHDDHEDDDDHDDHEDDDDHDDHEDDDDHADVECINLFHAFFPFSTSSAPSGFFSQKLADPSWIPFCLLLCSSLLVSDRWNQNRIESKTNHRTDWFVSLPNCLLRVEGRPSWGLYN